MKKFVIFTRTLKEYPDMDTACEESRVLGQAPGVLDVFVEELSIELANEIIADHEEEIGGTGIEGEQTGKVFDLAAFKNRRLNS